MKTHTKIRTIATAFRLLATIVIYLLMISSAYAVENDGTTVSRDPDGCTVRMTVQIMVDNATQAEFDDVKMALEGCYNRTCEIPCADPTHGHCEVICTVDVQKMADVPVDDQPKYHKVTMSNNMSSAQIIGPNNGAGESNFERDNSNGITGNILHRAWCHETLHLCGLEDAYCDLRRGNPDPVQVRGCGDPPGPEPCDCVLPPAPDNRCTKPCTGFEANLMATLDVDLDCANVLAVVALAGLNTCPDDPCCPAPEEGSSSNKDIIQGMSENLGTNIEIILDGIHPITNHFDGDFTGNGFQTFEVLFGNNTTSLRWSNPYAPIPQGDNVHVGWVTALPGGVIESAWRQGILWDPIWDGSILEIGHEILPLPLAPANPELRLTYSIPTSQPVLISDIYFLFSDNPLPLDQLKPENPLLDPASPDFAMLPLTTDGVELVPGAVLDLEIPSPAYPGQPIILRFSGSGNNGYVEYGQHIVKAAPADVPILTEWGMLVLGLILVLLATLIIIRRRRMAALN